jgi:GH15 family glucan-1,4-alpha-glucosidase
MTDQAQRKFQDFDLALIGNCRVAAVVDRHARTFGDAFRRNGRIMRYIKNDDFGAPETAFLLRNSWCMDALCLIGRKDEARQMSEAIPGCRSAFGHLSEDIHPGTGELWSNFPQAYSMAEIINTATRLSSSSEEAWPRV